MSYKYDPYTDRFTHIDDEGSTWVIGSFPNSSCTYKLVQQIELTDECIQRIAEEVVRLIKEQGVACRCPYLCDNKT